MSVLDNSLQALFSMAHKELLWKNASPSSGFAAQTISLNLSDYDSVIIRFRHVIDAKWEYEYSVAVGSALYCAVPQMALFAGGYNGVMYRQITVSNTGVTFVANYYKTDATTAAATVNNNYVIPQYIYGVKF